MSKYVTSKSDVLGQTSRTSPSSRLDISPPIEGRSGHLNLMIHVSVETLELHGEL
jgi:hypothetical protein